MDASAASPAPVIWFWGKLGRSKDVHPGFHPLICHMIDVAMVARAMWENVLSTPARGAITAGLGMEEPEAARDWIAFLAGAHDLGKACPAFQLRAGAEGLWERYGDLGVRPRGLQASDAHHGIVTARELPELLISRFGVAKPVATRLALVTGGHHGMFPAYGTMEGLSGDAVGRGLWRPARAALLDAFARVVPPPPAITPRSIDNATAMTLAGLISVADWIGSDEEHFPYAVGHSDGPLEVDIAAYASKAATKAVRALAKHGWTGWDQHEESRAFAALFPAIEGPPRPLQQTVIKMAEELAPGIAIIESPMGEGKTEAALYLADRWGVKPGPRGLYVALPTQATSNQMFTRVRGYLATRYPEDKVNIQLLHGHAALSAEYEVLRRMGDRLFAPRDTDADHTAAAVGTGEDFVPRDVDPEDTRAGVAAAAWFTGGKRGLLAAFGVGTVDQGLLAVLQTKHVFVRHFGLAHRVIVIDEIHAYDTYMTALLERLLEWLAALGSPVVLLSATLPGERRRKLLDAYARGMGVTALHEERADYPRVSWLPRTLPGEPAAVRVHDIPPSSAPRPSLALKWRPDLALDTPEGRDRLGQELIDRLEGGGCVAVICNTVARAQAVYRALRPYFSTTGPGGELVVKKANDGGPELDLFHARFVFEERAEREKRALVRFGKDGAKVDFGDDDMRPVQRPHRAVLVATQVIEQSLDVDFDLLITDLAPADLILQRAGRLHRHQRPRPTKLAAPEVWIAAPPEDGGVPKFPGGDTAVYDEHVLLRSWLALRDRASVAIPDDIEPLIEAVYDDRPCPDNASVMLRERWSTTLAATERKQRDAEEKAGRRKVPHPHVSDQLWEFTRHQLEEDSPDFHEAFQALTRDTEPSVQVVMLYHTPNGPALDESGQELITKRTRPNAALTRRLIERAVTITGKWQVRDLLKEDAPEGWQSSNVLRHMRLVELNTDGMEQTERSWRLRSDREVGVEVERSLGTAD